tara:strand:+ start:347 stop:1849 length:1503 start_codon:yes stop_codon:yes gene_type:complete
MSNLMSSFNMQRSRHDIRHFYEWLGYTWGKHISEWFELFLDRKKKEVHRVCLIAPRDHSKSTTLRVMALHSLLFDRWRNKPFTTWLFSASKELAKNRLDEIREDLKRHPDLSRLLDEKRGGQFELRLTNGSWIKATSVGSAIRGEHPARVILDDVLDDMGDMSDKNVRHWFRKKLTPMLSPGTSIFCVGTPLSMNDLYHTEMLENETWQTWCKGAVVNYDEYVADTENVVPICLWPEYRSIEFLLEQKKAMGDLAFAQEYLCRVVDDDSAVFPSRLTRANMNLESILEEEKLHGGRYSIGFDPSHGIGQDYSVMVVCRQDEQGHIHIVNVWRRNDFEPSRQTDEIVRLCSIYKNPIFASESVGFQRLYQTILEQRGAMVDYRPSNVANRTMKQALLQRLRSWFEQGKVEIPYGSDYTRKVMGQLLYELESHAWQDGIIVDKGKHNDMVMALAHAIDQFSNTSSGSSPIASSAVSMGSWKHDKPQKRPNRRSNGRYVRWGR